MATRCGSSSLFAILAVAGLGLAGIGGYNTLVRGCPLSMCDHSAKKSAATTLVSTSAAKSECPLSGGCEEKATACDDTEIVAAGCSDLSEKSCPMAKVAECKDDSKDCAGEACCKEGGACCKDDEQVAQKPAN